MKVNKTHTPQSNRLVAQRYDNLFKYIISAGWAVKSDGSVDAPSHYFAVVEIPLHDGEREEMRNALADEFEDIEFFDELPAGWYFTVEDELGFVWVYEMRDKADAEHSFRAHEKMYGVWCDRIGTEV